MTRQFNRRAFLGSTPAEQLRVSLTIARAFDALAHSARLAAANMGRACGYIEAMDHVGHLFHTWDVLGFDVGPLQFRARWFINHGWPRMEKDRQCWFIFAGPFEISSHRGRIF